MNKYIGYKIENCKGAKNLFYLKTVFSDLIKSSGDIKKPIEIGLDCYNPRELNLGSKLLKISKVLKMHGNTIIHLSLNSKLLNKEKLTEVEWLKIWNSQAKIVKAINPKYLVVHATSIESKVLSEEEQISNIHNNFAKVYSIFKKPLFVENTYEDLDFQKKLFFNAPKNMNFTFDIGHMKIHSKENQENWISFLTTLVNDGRKIHFHIHDNDGKSDQHKTLTEVNDSSVIAFTKKLLDLFPESNFILEAHVSDILALRKDLDLLV